MALTAAGKDCCNRRRTVLDELARVEKEIQGSNENEWPRECCAFSTECYTVYHWLPPRLRLFQHKFPAVGFPAGDRGDGQSFEALLKESWTWRSCATRSATEGFATLRSSKTKW